jgi:phage terminase Nu1 subunit (DNA packaging protein)
MTDEARQFLEVKSGLHSAFWRWTRAYIQEQSVQLAEQALDLIPKTLEEQIEREQTIGRAKALRELVDQIPNTINEKLKELGEQDEQ